MSNKIQLPVKLSAQEQQLFNYFAEVGVNKDLSIADLHDKMFPQEDTTDFRVVQQRLGAVIAKINRKKKPERFQIVPGNIKRTYRLVHK
jgi:hypothetical protein